MFGRQALSSAALAAIFGAALVVAGCAKPSSAPPSTGTAGTSGSSCSTGQTKCSQGCTNVNTDSANCGACGTVCKAGQTCQSGACTCGAGLLNCGGSCVSSNNANCGSCGMTCGSTEVCSNNTCSSSCAGGTTPCTNGTCANTMTDNLNCGACGMACSGGTTCTNGTCTGGGAGGTTGTAGTTGSGTGGTTGTAGTTGSGNGGTTGTAGTSGGTAGTVGTGSRACAPASANVLSDFEEGTATGSVMIQQGTPVRTGYWYVYYPGSPAAIMSGESQTPARSDSPILQSAATDVPPGDTAACDKFALHTTGSGFGTAPNNYAGFGASFSPTAAGSQVKNKYDLSAYTGIKFNIKSGAGTPPPLLFEMLTTDNQPAAAGGTAATATIDLYNSRGQMLATPWIPTAISTTWQTVTVPFGTLIPRWVPAPGAAMACPSEPVPAGAPKCQAPAFNPTIVLALQFSVYQDPGFSIASSSTPGTYDIWVDDVQLITDDSGLPTQAGFPLTGAGSVGSCTKPKTADGKMADGKFLVTAYNEWKKTFANNGAGPVIRPENGNDTVSEGIAYGMLIAVNMNDKSTFDNLYTYWKGKKGAGSGTAGLMTWCQPAGGNSCSSTGGSATDADEDAAFALIQAGKVFGGTYATDAAGLISDIWAKDIDSANNLPTYGSNAGNSTTSNPTNPSYFAPAYYRVFATIDSGHAWGTVATNSLNAINALAGTYGLVPAWCTKGCTIAGQSGYADDMLYQFDAHRVPMRVGLDYCWNATPAAKTYTDKITSFFATNSAAGLDGVDRIYSLYSNNGKVAAGTATTAAPNSASIIGTAAVGAMASPSAAGSFLNDAYQSVFDMATRGKLAPTDTMGRTPYSYYNASVGMLTLLMMTGNFSH